MNGKRPTAARRWPRSAGRAVERVLQERQQQRTGPRAAGRSSGGRAAAARAPLRAVAPAIRGLIARLRRLDQRAGTRPRGRRTRSAGAARRACSSASSRPSRISTSASQCVGLVHDVARDEQRHAVGGQRRGTCPTGRGAGRGSRPTVGSSRTRSRGSASSAVASDTRVRSPPDSELRPAVGVLGAGRRSSIASSTRASARPEHAREVAQVLARREVAVDRRRLRHVADLAAQGRRARRQAEDLDVAAVRPTWTPTMARIRVVLPHPLGPSRPVIAPAAAVERHRVQDLAAAALHPQPVDADRELACLSSGRGASLGAGHRADRRRRRHRTSPPAAAERCGCSGAPPGLTSRAGCDVCRARFRVPRHRRRPGRPRC